MTKSLRPHHDFDDLTTYDHTAFTPVRLALCIVLYIDMEVRNCKTL
jgi:hypothetical protein